MNPSHEITENTMISWDGTELFYRAWRPRVAGDKAVLIFHRGHEHSGRMMDLVKDLALDEFHIFAWDARGHGRSPGQRGYAENVGVLEKDVDAFVRFISSQYSIPLHNMVVLAHSVGAVSVGAWVHDYAPPIRAMVLATPALRVKLYVPFAIPFLRLKLKLLGPGNVKSYVKSHMLTHDPAQALAYNQDKLIFRQIADNLLVDLYDTATRLIHDSGAMSLPTLLLVSDADWVVKSSSQRRFFSGLSSRIKRMEVLAGFYHAVFHEDNRWLPIAKAREFILEVFRETPEPLSLMDADKRGYTRAEYDRLRSPSVNPAWPLLRAIFKTGAKLSNGIQLGWHTGFDSGQTLDYVYANKPQGITPLGRLIDRAYLNTIGWRGIRLRKVALEKLLDRAIEQVHSEGQPVRLLDIATGVGRYVLETMRRMSHIPITATLRDYKQENLDSCRQLANDLGVANVTFQHGDAFDRASLAAVSPAPTVAIVSGLYELFPDNGPVVDSLRGIADAMKEGGYLIYTNQPWHPQVEFIARVLINREGQPWVMRRRTQAEMDELVRSAGFEKVAMEIDPWGIFTVSLAQCRR